MQQHSKPAAKEVEFHVKNREHRFGYFDGYRRRAIRAPVEFHHAVGRRNRHYSARKKQFAFALFAASVRFATKERAAPHLWCRSFGCLGKMADYLALPKISMSLK